MAASWQLGREGADAKRGEELLRKVLKRAEQIKRAWKSAADDEPSEPTQAQADADEDIGAEEDEESREAA